MNPRIHITRNNILTGASSPVGLVTPDFIGQEYVCGNGATKKIFKANGLTNNDWLELGKSEGNGGGGEGYIKFNVTDPYAKMPNTFYKYNNHTHSTSSDGKQATEDVLTAYKDAGYLAITMSNHDTVSSTEVEGISHILGVEETTFEGHVGIAGNWNAKNRPTGSYKDVIFEQTNEENAHIFITMNHPKRDSQAFSDGELYKANCDAIEIFNSKDETNYEHVWDTLLSMGKKVWGIAVDDCHDVTKPYRFAKGWAEVGIDTTPTPNIWRGMIQYGSIESATGKPTSNSQKDILRNYIYGNEDVLEKACVDALDCEPNTVYYYSFKEPTKTPFLLYRIYFYDASGNFISYKTVGVAEGDVFDESSKSGSFTTPTNAKYINFKTNIVTGWERINEFPVNGLYIGKEQNPDYRVCDTRAKTINSLKNGHFYAVKDGHNLRCSFDESTNTITATSSKNSNIKFIGLNGTILKEEKNVLSSTYKIKSDDLMYVRVKSEDTTDTSKWSCSQPYYINTYNVDSTLSIFDKKLDTIVSEIEENQKDYLEKGYGGLGNVTRSTKYLFTNKNDAGSKITVNAIDENSVTITANQDLSNGEIKFYHNIEDCMYGSHVIVSSDFKREYTMLVKCKIDSSENPPTGVKMRIKFRDSLDTSTDDVGHSVGEYSDSDELVCDGTWQMLRAWGTTPPNRSVDGVAIELKFGSLPSGSIVHIKELMILEGDTWAHSNGDYYYPFIRSAWSIDEQINENKASILQLGKQLGNNIDLLNEDILAIREVL